MNLLGVIYILFIAIFGILEAKLPTFTGVTQVDFNVTKFSERDLGGRYVFNDTFPVSIPLWMITHHRRCGVDLDAVYVAYDVDSDSLAVGVDCAAICGDVDGDGNPSAVDPLAPLGSLGTDSPGMCNTETIALMFMNKMYPEFVLDPYAGTFLPSVLVGVSLQQCLWNYATSTTDWAAVAWPKNLQCTTGNASDPCVVENTLATAFPDSYFIPQRDLSKLWQTDSSYRRVSPLSVYTYQPNITSPHLEFIMSNYSQYPDLNFTAGKYGDEFIIGFAAYSGSDSDKSGEDAVYPDIFNIKFDCFGAPNGKGVLDVCGVCNGTNNTCLDCFGIPFGNATYDACGVCGGNNLECEDCFGIPSGNATYDACGVCGGNNGTCLDCFGIPLGTAKYDACGVCGGISLECEDCFGIPFGNATYDICGICGGNNETCLDCFGIQWGNAKYDIFGICGNDNKSDCAGNPRGNLTYDACGVCGGNNIECEDCFGIPLGTAKYDICGVCGGNNVTCTCQSYLGWNCPQLDYALLRWTIAATRIKLNDTLDMMYAIKHELPFYDYQSDQLNLVQFIDTLNTFSDYCLDSFDYGQVWFADNLAGNCVGNQCEELSQEIWWSL